MEKLLIELQKNFGLTKTHGRIITYLNEQNHKNAGDIAKNTKIPIGRIYDYLSELEELGVLSKSDKRPYIYRFKGLEELSFTLTRNKISSLVESQRVIFNEIESKGNHFERITHSQSFTDTHILMLKEFVKHFRYVSLHNSFPYVLYPIEKKRFLKLREQIMHKRKTITTNDSLSNLLMWDAYKSAFESGNKIEVVFERVSFDNHVKIIKSLGESFFDEWKKEILERLEKNNIFCYLIDEYTPFQIDVNEFRVNVSFRHEQIINGVVISGKGMIELYDKVFAQYRSRAYNAIGVIKKLKY